MAGLLVAARWLFLAGVAVLPVMQPFSADVLGAVVVPSDVLFVAAGACWLLPLVASRGTVLRRPFPIAACVYLVAVGVAAFASPTRRSSLERVVIDGYVVALGVMAFAFSGDASSRRRVALAWLVGTVITVAAALVGIVLFYAGLRDPGDNIAIGVLGSVPSGNYPRVLGLFLNSNMLCNFLIVGLLFALAVVGTRGRVAVAFLGSIGLTLAFTLSPGLGGAILAAAMWFAMSRRAVWSDRTRHAVLGLGWAAAIGFLVLTATLGPRAQTWADAVGTFWHHPVLGAGPGADVASAVYDGTFFTDAHNAWLSVLGQAGMVGFLAFLGVIGTVCVAAWRVRPLAGLPEPVRAAWCAFVGAVLYQGLSMSLEQTRHVWVLLGLLASGLASGGSSRDPTVSRDA